ncbi:sugar fermentation stimulation protein [Desulforamulus reducens MI-1]|uniref:Sugar fermentation stimulation protein homolog n=1 Tax=Desulforamulus reducens (strain ATCC BAA-1160 / DSM 100696 / MI-1) TaxID=349161 RepID=SFSA_DESRM|nr:DNA/RNA nuclease SfsA [Desulforamulus reducens]A4J7I8.1 RecName: Full=Sugar fermentation stimulation protein homolog [Desulforamulus reducens MI-1]ABO51041.1 sugar fermentation stimulation protein [Desulforamulus reducens MI-1]
MNGLNNHASNIEIVLPELIEAVFVERVNRFVGMVQVAGHICPAHVPSSGRMRELLFPGNIVYISPMPKGRKTQYRIHLAKYDDIMVSVDSLLPNRLMYKVLSEGAISHFAMYEEVKKEVGYGESRFDIYLKGEAGRCFIEVKSVTLVDEGVAKFPDAPSERGSKHLSELTRAVGEGYRSAVIFIIQRDDARSFSPNSITDPVFSQTLSQAIEAGVEIYALACDVSLNTVRLKKYIPVQL